MRARRRSGSGGDGPLRLHCSRRSGTAGARYSAIPPREALSEDSKRWIAGVDASFEYVAPSRHGATMVAEGALDVCLQPIGGPWDFGALAVIVEEAGGRFSDTTGAFDIYSGGPVIYSNGPLHGAVLDLLT